MSILEVMILILMKQTGHIMNTEITKFTWPLS